MLVWQVCVQTSMREANDRGYECLLVTDATGSYFPEFKAAAIAMIVAQVAVPVQSQACHSAFTWLNAELHGCMPHACFNTDHH